MQGLSGSPRISPGKHKLNHNPSYKFLAHSLVLKAIHTVYMKNTSEKHNANVMTLYLTSTYCKKINLTSKKPVISRIL